MWVLDPALPTVLAIFFMNVGGRFITLPLTDAQKKLLQHPAFTAIVLVSIFYIATRNFTLSVIMVTTLYVFLFVLLNEHQTFNIYSQTWLVREGLVPSSPAETLLDRYQKNQEKLVRQHRNLARIF
jgi:hypothetical protein